mgnify:FL=1
MALYPESRFHDLGFLPGVRSEFKVRQMNTSQRGDNNIGHFKSSGQCDIDMLQPMKKALPNMHGYSLGEVSQKMLKETKLDVTPYEIHMAYKTGELKRIQDIARYAYVDTDLPAKLFYKCFTLNGFMDMGNGDD